MTSTIYFPYNALKVFTAAKWAVQRAGLFNRINADERLFRITASHGFPIVGEDIELRIVAGGTKVKSICLTENPEEVDCKIDGSSIVLKTCFLKK